MITEEQVWYDEVVTRFREKTIEVDGVRGHITFFSRLMFELVNDVDFIEHTPMRWSPHRNICECNNRDCIYPHEAYDGRSSP